MPVTAAPPTPAPLQRMPPAWPVGETDSDAGFGALAAACTASGGLAHGDALARLLDEHECGSIVSLARLIAGGRVFGLRWRGEFWVPMFQFDAIDLSLRSAVGRVLAELGPFYDGWTLAIWFVRPNPRLHGLTPLALLDVAPETVLAAARGDRLVAQGRGRAVPPSNPFEPRPAP